MHIVKIEILIIINLEFYFAKYGYDYQILLGYFY